MNRYEIATGKIGDSWPELTFRVDQGRVFPDKDIPIGVECKVIKKELKYAEPCHDAYMEALKLTAQYARENPGRKLHCAQLDVILWSKPPSNLNVVSNRMDCSLEHIIKYSRPEIENYKWYLGERLGHDPLLDRSMKDICLEWIDLSFYRKLELKLIFV
jgi:hypothetical protein